MRIESNPFPRLTVSDVEELSAELQLDYDYVDLNELADVLNDMCSVYDRLAQLEPSVAYSEGPVRDSGWVPDAQENVLGAWTRKTEIRGSIHGVLAGVRIAVKDNIGVRGVPLTHGSSAFQGYTPETDATVVTRSLEAGGVIAGMATCEAFCVSGGSHTSAIGPVRNPHDPARTSGGSSGGSAALVASKEVELAIGTDQGGSIRGPASWCGVVGIKPTYGLVPYTGAIAGEMTLDHIGPIARNIDRCARFLEVLAGPDGLDPRQTQGDWNRDFTSGLNGRDLSDIKIGIVKEGFDLKGLSETVVDGTVYSAAWRFHEEGARVEDVSLPFHRDANAIRSAILYEGTASLVLDGLGAGSNWKGRYPAGLTSRMAEAVSSNSSLLPESLMTLVLAGRWARRVGGGELYSKAQNLGRWLARCYDDALKRNDILVMPTVPMRAPLLLGSDESLKGRLAASRQTGANAAGFNVTGHPALTVPCGVEHGLPIGLMLVGRRGEDALLLQAGAAVERHIFRMS